MLPALVVLGKMLLANGLPLIANAVLTKGKEVVEDKLGVKLDVGMTQDQLFALKQKEFEHQEFLIQAALEEKKVDFAAEQTEAQEVTKRWQADMAADSFLSKNIRPGSLAFLLIVVTVFAAMSAFDYNVAEVWVKLFGEILMAFVVLYVGSRGVEKGISIWRNK